MLDERVRNGQVDDLAMAMVELRNTDEAYRFFEDIFTIHELQDGREHGDHQPRQPLPDLWSGRLSADPQQAGRTG